MPPIYTAWGAARQGLTGGIRPEPKCRNPAISIFDFFVLVLFLFSRFTPGLAGAQLPSRTGKPPPHRAQPRGHRDPSGGSRGWGGGEWRERPEEGIFFFQGCET